MAHIRVSINRLREGMIMREDIYTRAGAILVSEGEIITKDVIRLLTRHFIEDVIVESPSGKKVEEEAVGHVSEAQFHRFEQDFQIAESWIPNFCWYF